MSAPLSQQLFHGTHVKLNPGDVIQPRHLLESDNGNYGVNPVYGDEVGTHAHAVNDVEEAKWFAGESARIHGGKPHVYEVKPLGKTKVRPLYDLTNEDLPKEARKIKEHLSTKGFKIVKKIDK